MFKKYQLKNGLTVLLVESHKSPVLSVQMWVKTGSADEKKEVQGISHFIEHLVFKGTEKFKVGEIASTVEGSGGELNAYTSFDQTVFYVTISSQFQTKALEVISEMMGFPTFDAGEIDNEREVVIEEIKRSNDSAGRQASRLLFSTMYQKHPYGVPVIGFEEIIRKVSTKKIREYFKARYVPSNMTLMIVGDFSSTEMKKQVEQHFGRLKKSKLTKIVRAKEPAIKKPKFAVKKSTFAENFLFLTWPVPPVKHKDTAALDVLAMILGQGETSRLNKSLRMERSLVNYIGASSFTPKDPGFFAVSASLNAEKLKETLERVNTELGHILEKAPDREELSKALVNSQSEQYYALETVDGMARKFGHFEDLFNDYKYFNVFLKQLASLKPEDISRVARKYLRPESLSAIMLTSQDEAVVKPELMKFANDFKVTYAKNKKAIKAANGKKSASPQKWFPTPATKFKKLSDRSEKFVLSNGSTVLMRPNYDTPVVSVKAALLGGGRRENQDQAGVNELLSRTWVSATKRQSEEKLLGRIEHMATNLSAYAGRNSCGLNLTALKPFADEALDLFAEVLCEPFITSDVVEREKVVLLEQHINRRDNPAQIAVLKFMEQMFKDHPYGRDPMGTEKSVKGIHNEIVQAHLAPMAVAENLTFSVTGYFDPDVWRRKLEKIALQLPAGKKQLATLPYTPPKKLERIFEKSAKEQTHLVIGYPGLKLTDKRRYTLHVLEAILAGQGGRLFLELRDKASLAYSVAPLRLEGIESGYFGAYIGCSPEKGTKALEMLHIEFNKLRDSLVPAAELDRAKKYLLGRHDIDLQKASSVAGAMLFDDIYGIDFTETFRFAENLGSVTSKDVQTLAEQIFSGVEVASAVGPTAPW